MIALGKLRLLAGLGGQEDGHVASLQLGGLVQGGHLGVPVRAYETEAAFAADDKQNGSLLMMYESITCKVHEAFKDGETFQIGEVPVTVLHTPGHTAGGVSYITPDAVFTGDTLMGYSVGRCDLPTGNSAELRESLKKLAALPGNPDICGGHGPVTTLEDEKRRNPYL